MVECVQRDHTILRNIIRSKQAYQEVGITQDRQVEITTPSIKQPTFKCVQTGSAHLLSHSQLFHHHQESISLDPLRLFTMFNLDKEHFFEYTYFLHFKYSGRRVYSIT